MSERSFSSPLEDSLFSSAFGDVLAARAAALALLTAWEPAEDPFPARLILTAVLIQAVLDRSGHARLSDVERLCEAFLAPGARSARLGRSSSQFVRYAAEEVHAWEAGVREQLLRNLTRALRTRESSFAATVRRRSTAMPSSQKRDKMP